MLPKPISPVAIHADCMTALGRTYNQVYNGKSRHIALRHGLVQGFITNRVITFDYVNTKFNVVDSFTKSMSRFQLNKRQLQSDYVNRCHLKSLIHT